MQTRSLMSCIRREALTGTAVSWKQPIAWISRLIVRKKVKDILVSEGDEVQVGTPLFTYDTKDLAAKKESATLELESLNNTLSGYDAPDRAAQQGKEGSVKGSAA